MEFKRELEQMRDRFEQNRPVRLRLHRPWWMFADDELSKIYQEKEELLKHGTVYYANLLQANIKLFRPFPPFDYPAQIVYSVDDAAEENPLILQKAAEEIYSYKNSNETPPEKWQDIVANVEDEKDRTAFTLNLVADSHPVTAKLQTIMVFRKHLPTGILKGSVLPIIACPERCDSVLILPKDYWTDDFTTYWLGD